MSAEPMPDWLRPPPQGFMADDLDRLPELPPHTELIDGSLVFGSPQSKFHALVIFLLMSRLSSAAPSAMRVRKYASAEIGHFWRIENVDDRPVVYTYELDPATKSYVPTGIHHDRLQTTVPFPIDIDLTEVDKL